jgi:hypothetical protein
MYTYINVRFWEIAGGGAPKSALYGIWEVEELSIDGEVRLPVLNDYDRRWRRVLFDSPDRMAVQRTDDSFARYGVSIDTSGKTVTLTKGDPPARTWSARFTYERPSEDRLVLDGEMDGYRVRALLMRVELDTFRLLSGGFRWIRSPDL